MDLIRLKCNYHLLFLDNENYDMSLQEHYFKSVYNNFNNNIFNHIQHDNLKNSSNNFGYNYLNNENTSVSKVSMLEDSEDIVVEDSEDIVVEDSEDIVVEDSEDIVVEDSEDIVVEDSEDIVIEVSNLTMEFKVNKDKIDTLKEYIIRSIKRNKTDSKKVRVLEDISFKLNKGDRLGVLGLNGAGKSTLLKILAGIYEPTSGTVNINGNIAPLLELGAGFDYNYSGKNNIFLNGAFLGLSEDFLNEKYDEIVEFSELGEHINYPVKNYSSGMRAKLGFSIATIVEPDILIIDEILSVGDIKFKRKSSKKLRSLFDSGVTVILVSHAVGQIRDLCNKAIWIENGKIVMQGDAEEVCNAYIDASKD